MIAMQDIAELFDTDLQGQPLGAIRDFGFSGMVHYGGPEGLHWSEYVPRMLGFSDLENYINSGLLLMDLMLWRRDYPLSCLLETAYAQNWECHDQDVINRVFHGHIQYLEPCWGVYDILVLARSHPSWMQKEYEKALREPKLFHFASQHPKSWQNFNSVYSLQFWANAAQTPFYDILYGQFLSSVQQSRIIPELLQILNSNGCTIPASGSWNRNWENDRYKRMLLFFLLLYALRSDPSFLMGEYLIAIYTQKTKRKQSL